jgi:hypothetical protein
MGSMGLNIAAAFAGVELPAWSVCSGCLGDGSEEDLPFQVTARIADKVRFCLDDPAAAKAAIELYQEDRELAAQVYGPRERRSVPGEVRLFLASEPMTTDDFEVLAQLGVKMEQIPLGQLRGMCLIRASAGVFSELGMPHALVRRDCLLDRVSAVR